MPLSIPLNGFRHSSALFTWVIISFITFNSIEWIPDIVTYPEGEVAVTQTFNSIEWILHHHGLCCVWKFFHFHSYGFYSIKPPGGGS